MRLLLPIIIALSLSACVTLEPPQPREGGFTLYDIDFRKYSEQGFLFTSNPPEGNYDSKGILRVTLTPKVVNSTASNYRRYQDEGPIRFDFGNGSRLYTISKVNVNGSDKYYGIEVINFGPAIDEIYQTASSYGANAITNFDIQRSPINNNGLIYSAIEVTGFAVKRMPGEVRIVE